MKPDELLQQIEHRWKRAEREYRIAKAIIEQLDPELDVKAVHGHGAMSEATINLQIERWPGPEALKSLEPNMQLRLMKHAGTTSFVPDSYYVINVMKYKAWLMSRIEPVFFSLEFPPNKTTVRAKWFVKMPNEMVALVVALIHDHGFVLSSEQRLPPGVEDFGQHKGKKERVWIYEPPEYMDGYDHVQWWGEGKGPRSRDYYRLAADGWDGG